MKTKKRALKIAYADLTITFESTSLDAHVNTIMLAGALLQTARDLDYGTPKITETTETEKKG